MLIYLNNVKFFCSHGISDQEITVGNEFEVSVEVEIPDRDDWDIDYIGDTLSYVDLYDIVKEEMEEQTDLIETVAYRIAERIKELPNEVIGGRVEVKKVAPPIPGMEGSAGVILKF